MDVDIFIKDNNVLDSPATISIFPDLTENETTIFDSHLQEDCQNKTKELNLKESVVYEVPIDHIKKELSIQITEVAPVDNSTSFVMEPRIRASPEQFSVLIDFMERYGDLSRHHPGQPGFQGRLKSDKLWQDLAIKLNCLGGGVQKSSDKWKKVWADWKTKTKKKYLIFRKQVTSHTGKGPRRNIRLTALENRVVAVMGMPAVVDQASIQEQVLNTGSANELPLEHALDKVLEDHNNQNITICTPDFPVIQSVDMIDQMQESLNTATPPYLPSQSPTPPPSPHQDPVSPTPTAPRRALLKARRNRGLTPFERAAELFANVEQKRLEHEEERDKRLHEREMERLRLESEKIVVTKEQNLLFHQLSLLGQQLIDVLSQQRPGSSTSTDPISSNKFNGG